MLEGTGQHSKPLAATKASNRRFGEGRNGTCGHQHVSPRSVDFVVTRIIDTRVRPQPGHRREFSRSWLTPPTTTASANSLSTMRNVAALARGRAEPFGSGDLAFLAGPWHDAGKADPEWQRDLLESEAGTRTRGSGPEHKSGGALLAEEARQPLVAPRRTPRSATRPRPVAQRTSRAPRSDAMEALRAEMPDLPAARAFVRLRMSRTISFAAELFLRLTYSALVDADSLDTGRTRCAPRRSATRKELWARAFLERQQSVPDTPVNRVPARGARGVPGCCGRTTRPVPTDGADRRGQDALRDGVRPVPRHRARHAAGRGSGPVHDHHTADRRRAPADLRRGSPDRGRVVLEHHSAAVEGDSAEEDEGPAAAAVSQRRRAHVGAVMS